MTGAEDVTPGDVWIARVFGAPRPVVVVWVCDDTGRALIAPITQSKAIHPRHYLYTRNERASYASGVVLLIPAPDLHRKAPEALCREELRALTAFLQETISL